MTWLGFETGSGQGLGQGLSQVSGKRHSCCLSLGWGLGWVVKAGTGPGAEPVLGEGRDHAGAGALFRAFP